MTWQDWIFLAWMATLTLLSLWWLSRGYKVPGYHFWPKDQSDDL
jgi:hypothetical protein